LGDLRLAFGSQQERSKSSLFALPL